MAKKISDDLKRLYRELGYLGALEEKPRKRGAAPRDDKAASDLPPLDADGLKQIEALLRRQPNQFLKQFRAGNQMPLTNAELREGFAELHQAFKTPGAHVAKLQTARRQAAGPRRRGDAGLPPSIQLYGDIKIEPQNRRFEPLGDLLGWIVNSAGQYVAQQTNLSIFKDRFPAHADHPGRFIYAMKDRAGRPADPEQKISVALFGDFGTGVYHSLHIARQMAELQPDYAVHLGDVYYAGRSSEFEKYFNAPLAPLIRQSRFFTLNANHEMLSGGKPYFHFIDQRRQRPDGGMAQEQEGSYFCIRGPRCQIIGIDTAFHKIGRHNQTAINQWLEQCLREGKKASPRCVNILLSQNEPYELGEKKFTAACNDLKRFIDDKLIDFWFWGNTHYSALFNQNDRAPFIGSCCGHAGHPVFKKNVDAAMQKHAENLRQSNDIPAAAWVDDSRKFPDHVPNAPNYKNPRPDLGNNGFCLLELEGDKFRLIYYDWLKNIRHVAEFSA